MRLSQSSVVLAAIGGVASAPLTAKRADITDADILNYALTLEHLEATFYAQGLDKFDEAAFAAAGIDADGYANIKEIAKDESDHVDFLTAGLTAAGASPVAACEYNFGVTDVASMLTVASILEGVGVSAYLGAAASIMDKTYLTAAGSILTVEARHSSYIRATKGESPFPQAFDAPLTFNEVYSLAAQFITSCPDTNVALPVKAFPALTVTADGDVKSGSTVKIAGSNLNITEGTTVYAAFIAVTGPTFVEAHQNGDGSFDVTVPTGFAGQTYAVLTNSNSSVSDDTTIAGPAIIEISW